VHRADPELGGTGTHARFHNVYGMLMSRATWEGCLAARPQQRPFVLTRALPFLIPIIVSLSHKS
jgi:alpha-glucosidase